MKLNVDRLKHSYAVALKMKDIVFATPDQFQCKPNDMYILGMLHDIGYEFVDKQENHAHVGGEVLKEQGYRFWKEVYYHGIFQNEYDSPELNLLNYVDMITGPTGKYMTIQERIEDIADRYGKESKQELEAIQLARAIKLEDY